MSASIVDTDGCDTQKQSDLPLPVALAAEAAAPAPAPPSRIPRLQRSASFHEKSERDDAQIRNRPSSLSLSVPKKKTPVMNDEEELEALDSFSVSSAGSAVSCCLPGVSYAAAVRSSVDQRVRRRSPNKYTLHCNTSEVSGAYQTPTQRANQMVRRLNKQLEEAQTLVHLKDLEVKRLTKELVQLRLEHAQSKPLAPVNELTPSLADSGHFDDLITGRHSSKESLADKELDATTPSGSWANDKRRLITFHMEQINDLKRQHTDQVQSIRGRLTDRLEQALEQLGESNSRYAALLVSFERQRDQLETADSELRLLRDASRTRQEQVSRLQAELEERETLEYEMREKTIADIDTLNKQLTDRDQRIAQLQSSVEEQYRERESFEEGLRKESLINIDLLTKQLDDRNQSITELESTIEKLSKDRKSFEKSLREKSLDDIDALNKQLLDRDQRIAQLQSATDQQHKDRESFEETLREKFLVEIKALNERLADREQRITELELIIENQRKDRASFEENFRQKSLLDMDALSKQLIERDQHIAQLEADNEQQHKYRASLEESVRKKTIDEVSALKEMLNSRDQRVAQLETIIEQLQKDWERKSKETNEKPTLEEQLRIATEELEKWKELAAQKNNHGSDAEVTLRFLRSAVFHLLTDQHNVVGHVRAVQSILEFSEEERAAVNHVLHQGYLI